jgi:hypothetical protein
MPDVADYKTEKDWMAACVPVRIDEGEEQDQAVAVCLNIWRNRNKAAIDGYAPICDTCAAKVVPELWELTMTAVAPTPCIYCGSKTRSLREYRKAVDPNVGGGVDREKLKDSSFVFPDERKFPIVTPGDVSDAVSSWGRYKGPKSFETFKSRLIALCKRKGSSFVAALPKEWRDEMGKGTVGELLQEAFTTVPSSELNRLIKEDATIADLDQYMVNFRHNSLKALSRTDAELRVANYIVLFGGRDLEGLGSDNKNADGSLGEYFTPQTVLDSPYTKAGALYVNWEHGLGELGDELLGVVDWKTARVDDRGVFVERVLNRRNQYVQWVEGLIDAGLIGTSSEAAPESVEKAANGEIVRWPLYRDTLTVQPMEPRMLTENVVQAFKALGIQVPDDTTEPEPETETEPEAEPSAASVVKARARAEIELINQMEV